MLFYHFDCFISVYEARFEKAYGHFRSVVKEAMVRPILALERLVFLEGEGKVGYRHGDDGAELERMDYLELIARVKSHIPDKGQVMVRYFGLYANAHRGKVKKAGRVPVLLGTVEQEPRPVPCPPACRRSNP